MADTSRIPFTLIIMCIGLLLQLLSLALPFWHKKRGFHSGLWQVCTKNCLSIDNPNYYFQVFRGLEVLGLIGGVFAVATCAIGKYTQLLRPSVIQILYAAHCIRAGVLILMGITVLTCGIYDFSACYVLSMISAVVLCILGGRRLTTVDSYESIDE